MKLEKSLGQDIQISRGNINKRKQLKSFISGELFYDYLTQDLWIGGNKDTQEVPISIGGLNGIKWQGNWDKDYFPTDTQTVLPGYLYYCETKIEKTSTTPEILPEDLILYVEDKTKPNVTGEGFWVRINQTKGTARLTSFDTLSLVDLPKAADSLQKAVSFLDRFKLGWGENLAFIDNVENNDFLAKLQVGKMYGTLNDFRVTEGVYSPHFAKIKDNKLFVTKDPNDDLEPLVDPTTLTSKDKLIEKIDFNALVIDPVFEDQYTDTGTFVGAYVFDLANHPVELYTTDIDNFASYKVEITTDYKTSPLSVTLNLENGLSLTTTDFLKISELKHVVYFNIPSTEKTEILDSLVVNCTLENGTDPLMTLDTYTFKCEILQGDTTKVLYDVYKGDLIYCGYRVPEGYTGGNCYEIENNLEKVLDSFKKVNIVKVGQPLATNISYNTKQRPSLMAINERAISDKKAVNVKEALDLYMDTKADLDSFNRVYLDQLPAFMFHGLHYMGLWDNGLTNSSWNPPELTYPNNIDPLVDRGFFWLWTGLNYEYIDSIGNSHIIRPGDMLISNSTITRGTIPGWEVYHRSDQVESEMGLMTESSTEAILRGVVKFRGITRPSGTIETTVTNKGEIIYVSTPNALVTNSVVGRDGLIYKEVSANSKEMVPSNIIEIDDTIQFEKDLVVVDEEGNRVKIQVGSLISGILKDLTIQLPTKSGTLATTEDIEAEYAQANPTSGFLPVKYRDKKGHPKFQDSKVRDTELGISIVQARGTGGAVVSEIELDVMTRIDPTNTPKIMFPGHSGVVLNSRSVIDGYYWGDDIIGCNIDKEAKSFNDDLLGDNIVMTGKPGDYVIWAKDASSLVTKAFETRNYGPFGSLLIQVMGGDTETGYFALPSQEIQKIKEYILKVSPPILLEVKSPEFVSVDMTITIPYSPDPFGKQEDITNRINEFFSENCRPSSYIYQENLQKVLEGDTKVEIKDGVFEVSATQFPILGTIKWEFKAQRQLSFHLNTDLAGYTCTGKGTIVENNIEIPSTHEGKPVTAIGESAFANEAITSILLPNSIKSIEAKSLQNCTSLETITIPEGVVNIGESAFDGCTNLILLSIPSSVETIGSNILGNCKKVSVSISPENINYKIIEKNLYTTDEGYPEKQLSFSLNTDLTGYICTGKGTLTDRNITIPSSFKEKPVVAIGKSAFVNQDLVEVIISEGVLVIGEAAFEGCSDLELLTIPSSVETIEPNILGNCKKAELVISSDNLNYKVLDKNLYTTI